MVEVFKTNITDKNTALKLIADLHSFFPGGRINFDLDDCDKILRIEREEILPELVTEFLAKKGYNCEILE